MKTSIAKQLVQLTQCNQATLLGIGPVSQNCIDSAIELANEYKKPLILIASRRQIDDADFGGGYVNNWTTENFCHYVRTKDHGGYVLMARDHGGPWQNNNEITQKMLLAEAMKSAKKSYKTE